MNCFVVFVILFVIFQQNIADDTVTGNDKDYDAYDDNSAEGFNLDPDLDFETDLNTIGNSDDTRQIVMNPRERRQRRRKQQAAYNELNGLEFCWTKHDECDSIEPLETKSDLTNDEEQQFWHCNCEMEFYDCLHRINSTVSNRIGELYFNSNTRCYRRDREIQECHEYEYRTYGEPRCVQYVLEINSPVETQWFDLPFYSGEPMKKPLFVVGHSEDLD